MKQGYFVVSHLGFSSLAELLAFFLNALKNLFLHSTVTLGLIALFREERVSERGERFTWVETVLPGTVKTFHLFHLRYGLGIYMLNLFIGFLSPVSLPGWFFRLTDFLTTAENKAVDPETEETTLPVKESTEYRLAS